VVVAASASSAAAVAAAATTIAKIDQLSQEVAAAALLLARLRAQKCLHAAAVPTSTAHKRTYAQSYLLQHSAPSSQPVMRHQHLLWVHRLLLHCEGSLQPKSVIQSAHSHPPLMKAAH
jgi:hypothetical protein